MSQGVGDAVIAVACNAVGSEACVSFGAVEIDAGGSARRNVEASLA